MLGLKPCDLGVYPKALMEVERSLHGSELGDSARLENQELRVGIALSGGGVRSATFSLGVLQALARLKLLRHVAYLSTVSGGGYIGGFLGRLFLRDLKRIAPAECERARSEPAGYRPIYAVEEILKNSRSRPIAFLRRNGRYLAPAGSGDLLTAVAVLLRNWISVLVLMGTLALALFALLAGVRYLAWSVDFANPSSGWPSPLYWPALGLLVLFAVPLGWSYWLTPAPRRASRWYLRWAAPLLLAGVLLGWTIWGQVPEGWLNRVRILGVLPLLAMAYYGIVGAGIRLRSTLSARGTAEGQEIEDSDRISEMRSVLSILLKVVLAAVAFVLTVWLVDSAGWMMYRMALGDFEVAAAVYSGIAALALLARKGAMVLTLRGPKEGRPPVSVNVLAHLVAFLVAVAILALISAISHAVIWESFDATRGPRSWITPLIAIFLSALVLSILMGRVWPFVNRSTLHPLYEARLRRAYLGASNPVRILKDTEQPPVTRVHPDDGVEFEDYHPERQGAPIHILNVTVNQTVGSRSPLQHKDRKGMGLAIGPAGVSLGRSHHALWDDEIAEEGLFARLRSFLVTRKDREKVFRVFSVPASPEELDLGHWISISGAAFSTGLGYRTSLGLSLLAGLFNIRLGYWWNSGIDPDSRYGAARPSPIQRGLSLLGATFPVQAAFLGEWFARFRGVAAKHWYLSDGGHFDNTGAYELIRRRLPLIIVCDNEQDEGYQFSGLANLVRKARTDFGAEIAFLSGDDLAHLARDERLLKWLGPLESLRRGHWAEEPVADPRTGRRRVAIDEPQLRQYSLAHAALARISYADEAGEEGAQPRWLLYIKPTLVGDEPVDVLNYHNDNPRFPQEPTSDQFFGEAQWESYRRLGEHIASKLFSEYKGEWSPVTAMRGAA